MPGPTYAELCRTFVAIARDDERGGLLELKRFPSLLRAAEKARNEQAWLAVLASRDAARDEQRRAAIHWVRALIALLSAL
jgi:hypothetical protein